MFRTIQRGARFVDPVQANIGKGEVFIGAQAIGRQFYGVLGHGKRLIKLSQVVVDICQIDEWDGIAWIGLLIEFQSGNTLVELAAVRVVVRSDVELFAFTGAVATFGSLL